MPDAPEQTTETAEEAPAVETTAPGAEEATEVSNESKKPTETVEFWKAKAREQEKRAKENDRAANKLREIEESQKTELQKWQERAESAEGAISALQAAHEIRETKDALSKQYGVPVEALRGSDADELEEHAKLLKDLLPEPRKAGQVPSEGRTVNAGNNDPAQQFANIIANARRG